MSQSKTVKISEIRENPVALRSVNKQTEAYTGLVDSIAQMGILNPISVRERVITDQDTGTEIERYYELIDGLHRFSAAIDAGLDEMTVNILDLQDADVLVAQIVANVHKVETRPVEYSKQLRRILASDPMMTRADLARNLGKSPQWLDQRLGLVKIEDENIARLIDEGKITLANAYALAKLPTNEQVDWLDRAMTLQPDEFAPQVNKRISDIRDAKRQGREVGDSAWEPTPHVRKVRELKDEMESPKVVQKLLSVEEIRNQVPSSPEAAVAYGFALAIRFALHMDSFSIEEQRSREEARKQEREEAKKRREGESSKKKAENAAKKAKEAAMEAANIKALSENQPLPYPEFDAEQKRKDSERHSRRAAKISKETQSAE